MSRKPEIDIKAGEDKVVIVVSGNYGSTMWTITPSRYDISIHGEYLNSKGEAQEEVMGIRPVDANTVVMFI